MILFQKDFSIPLSSKESSLKHWKVLWYDLMASSFSLKGAGCVGWKQRFWPMNSCEFTWNTSKKNINLT